LKLAEHGSVYQYIRQVILKKEMKIFQQQMSHSPRLFSLLFGGGTEGNLHGITQTPQFRIEVFNAIVNTISVI
jgi:hypothetical protein